VCVGGGRRWSGALGLYKGPELSRTELCGAAPLRGTAPMHCAVAACMIVLQLGRSPALLLTTSLFWLESCVKPEL
jgi:hypothetical protein